MLFDPIGLYLAIPEPRAMCSQSWMFFFPCKLRFSEFQIELTNLPNFLSNLPN